MTQVKETVSDRRKSPAVWLSVALDDIRISSDSFRVYFHIVRRVGKHEKAWPSYRSIGVHCFPELKEDSARIKAIKAVKELIAWNLIEVEKNQTATGFHSNNYYLTDDSEWRNPDGNNGTSEPIPSSPTLPPPSSVTLPPSSPTLPIRDLQYKDFKILKDSQVKKDPPTPQRGNGFLSQEGDESLIQEQGREDSQPETPARSQTSKQAPFEQTNSSSGDQTSPAPTPIFSVHKKEHQDRIVAIYQSNKPVAWQPLNNLHRAIRVMVDSLLSSEDFRGDLEAFLTRLENALLELKDPSSKFGWFRNQGNLGITTLLSNYGKHLMEFSEAWTARQTSQAQTTDSLPDWLVQAYAEMEQEKLKKAG